MVFSTAPKKVFLTYQQVPQMNDYEALRFDNILAMEKAAEEEAGFRGAENAEDSEDDLYYEEDEDQDDCEESEKRVCIG